MFTQEDTDRITVELWNVIDGRKTGQMDTTTANDITNACGKLIKNFALQLIADERPTKRLSNVEAC